MATFDADDERAQFPNWAHFLLRYQQNSSYSNCHQRDGVPASWGHRFARPAVAICEWLRNIGTVLLRSRLRSQYRVWQRADVEATGMVYSSTSSRVVHVRTTDCARCGDG